MRLLEDGGRPSEGMPAEKLFMDRESRRVVSVSISENIEQQQEREEDKSQVVE